MGAITNALFEAYSNKQFKVMKVLVDHGADVSTRTHNDTTCLHAACIKGDLRIVKFLLDHGADINAEDEEGSTPFGIAFEKENMKLITLLLKRGADPDPFLRDMYTQPPSYTQPCSYTTEDSYTSEYTHTPLMSATAKNDINMMKLLLKYNAGVHCYVSVDDADDIYSETSSPLILACQHGHIDALNLLPQHGVDINYIYNADQNESSLICLFRSRAWRSRKNAAYTDDLSTDKIACLRLLLEYGADVAVTDTKGNTAFDYVKDRPTIISILNEYMDVKPILK